MSNFHTSVLLQEAIDGLNIYPGEKYIDATLGGGGHTFEIIKRGGVVLAIDRDEEAIEFVKNNFHESILSRQLIIAKGNFTEINKIAKNNGFEKVAGILFDLGVSNHQLESTERGFSFSQDSILDMRMDKNLGVTASDLINGLHKGELEELFEKYGEEKFARRIAEIIIRERLDEPVNTTTRLAKIISSIYPRRKYLPAGRQIHPATRIFQALRIAVNDELASLETALPEALGLLKNKGRLVVISFHSLEDRIVKQTFLDWGKNNFGEIKTCKPISPSLEELESNRKSRSSKMRIFEKNNL